MAMMKNRQAGVAMVELAIILPLLLAICFAVTEFGRAIYTYNTLAKSARDAARYLSTQAAGNGASWGVARNLVAYGNPIGDGPLLVPGLDKNSMVTICDASYCAGNLNQGSNPVINTVTVTITGYSFSPVIDLLAFTNFYSTSKSSLTSITFGDISVTMRQQS
jgi:Flp pilus assembly protein TadG